MTYPYKLFRYYYYAFSAYPLRMRGRLRSVCSLPFAGVAHGSAPIDDAPFRGIVPDLVTHNPLVGAMVELSSPSKGCITQSVGVFVGIFPPAIIHFSSNMLVIRLLQEKLLFLQEFSHDKHTAIGRCAQDHDYRR